MFSMSPEDRLRFVMHDQDELRAQMARERLASAASGRGTTEQSGARDADDPRSRHLWMMVKQRLLALTGRRGAAQHEAAR